jgi:hypothetical protein
MEIKNAKTVELLNRGLALAIPKIPIPDQDVRTLIIEEDGDTLYRVYLCHDRRQSDNHFVQVFVWYSPIFGSMADGYLAKEIDFLANI